MCYWNTPKPIHLPIAWVAAGQQGEVGYGLKSHNGCSEMTSRSRDPLGVSQEVFILRRAWSGLQVIFVFMPGRLRTGAVLAGAYFFTCPKCGLGPRELGNSGLWQEAQLRAQSPQACDLRGQTDDEGPLATAGGVPRISPRGNEPCVKPSGFSVLKSFCLCALGPGESLRGRDLGRSWEPEEASPPFSGPSPFTSG